MSEITGLGGQGVRFKVSSLRFRFLVYVGFRHIGLRE